MNIAISDKAKIVLDTILEHDGEDLTAQDICDMMPELFDKKSSVDGVVTAGLIRNRNLVERVSGGVVATEKGPKEIKYIKVTDAGRAYDHEAALAADAEAKAAEIAAKAAAKAAKAE